VQQNINVHETNEKKLAVRNPSATDTVFGGVAWSLYNLHVFVGFSNVEKVIMPSLQSTARIE